MTTPLNDELRVLVDVTTRLENAGIAYMVSGSLAMSFYAQPRMTRDIDIVVELLPKDASRIVALFEKDCYIDGDAVRDALQRRGMFNVIHNELVIKVDFIVRKDEPYRREEFARKRRVAIEDAMFYAVAPEDLVLSKLLWAKHTSSEMQLRDVQNLLVSVTDLDRKYIESWARRLDVFPLLEKAGRDEQ